MADLIAMGVVMAGSYAGLKFGPSLAKGIKLGAGKARVQLRVLKGKIVEIKTLIPKKTLELRLPKPEPKQGGLQLPDKADAATTPHVVEADNATVADGQTGRTSEIVSLEVKRPKALDQSADEFEAASNLPAQQELYDAAKGVVERQNALAARVLKKVGLPLKAEPGLKRNKFSEFVEEVAFKVRKIGRPVGAMPDIVRGRFNPKDPKDVGRIVKALLDEVGSRRQYKEPAERCGVPNGYRRYHVIVTDEATGILFEWQIGTEATTKLYEKPGIEPGKVKTKKSKFDLHLEYDVFAKLQEPGTKLSEATRLEYQALAKDLGIPEFRRRLYEFSARTGMEEIPPAELNAQIDAFLREATEILARLVDKKGPKFVEDML